MMDPAKRLDVRGEAAIARLIGEAAPGPGDARTAIFNHRWDDPGALATVGVIGEDEMART